MDDAAARFSLDPSLVVRKGVERPAQSQVLTGEGSRRRELDLRDPLLIATLFRLQLPLTKEEITSLLSLELGISATEAAQLLEKLLDAGALAPASPIPPSWARWDRWGWRDALDLQLATRETSGMLQTPPHEGRTFSSHGKRIALPGPTGRLDGVSFLTALQERRTHRSFEPRPVELGTLSDLLHAAFSAGLSRFSAYPMLLNVEGLQPGVYRYAAEEHALDEIRSGELSAELVELSQGQAFLRDVPVAVFMSVFWVAHMLRRADSQGYRQALLEMAGLVQGLLLGAAGLGLKSFMTAVVSETAAAKLLKIEDPLQESPMYLVGLGYGRNEPRAFDTGEAEG